MAQETCDRTTIANLAGKVNGVASYYFTYFRKSFFVAPSECESFERSHDCCETSQLSTFLFFEGDGFGLIGRHQGDFPEGHRRFRKFMLERYPNGFLIFVERNVTELALR